MTRLSIIILNHNKAAYSRLLLDSLLATLPHPAELLLVDNGSADDTPHVLLDFAARAGSRGHAVKTINFETNVGAIEGRNAAMAAASGEYFAFLDNDLVVRDADWTERLMAVLEQDREVGIVSPKLVFPWEPYDIEFAGCDVTVGGRVIYRGRGEPRETPEFNQRRDCPCLISACILFRADLYRRIGGLDPIFNPVQFEDLDFCYRARAHGYRCLYVPEVEMYHWEHTTTAGSGDINFKLVTLRNGRTFKQRWEPQILLDAELPDSAAAWREVAKYGLDDVARPPVRR